MSIYDNAISAIYNAQTLSEIQGIVSQYSASATGTGGVLYSGEVSGRSAGVFAGQIAETGVSILDATPRGQLLVEAQQAILTSAARILSSEMSGEAANAAAQTFLYGGARGTVYQAADIASSLWGQASYTFASTLSGDISIVGSLAQASPNATLAVVELPALLNNPNITSIGGVAVADLKAAGPNAFSLILNQFNSLIDTGIYVSGDGLQAVLSKEALNALGYSAQGARTAAELAAQSFASVTPTLANDLASSILGVVGDAALKFLTGPIGGSIITILTSATPANENENEILRQANMNNYASDLPANARVGSITTNADGSTSLSAPLRNADGSLASEFELRINPSQTEVSGAVTYAEPGNSGATGTTTSLFDSAASSSPVGQIESMQSGPGQMTIVIATPQQTARVEGTTIDTTQVTPLGSGAFTVGSSHPDSFNYTNQLSLPATSSFGISGLSVTDPTTGQTTTVPLNNGSSTTLQEGRSAATGASNEQVQTTNADGSQKDVIFGQGAQADINNAFVALAPAAQTTVAGNNNQVADDASAPNQQARNVTIVGDENKFTGQAGDVVNWSANSGANFFVSGTGGVAVNATGGTVHVEDNWTNVIVSGTTNIVNEGANQIIFMTSAGETLSVQQNNATILGVSGTINIEQPNLTTNVYWSNNLVNLIPNANETLSITGTGQTVRGDTGTDTVSIFGTGTSLNLGGNGIVGINGLNNYLSLLDGANTVYTAPNISGFYVAGSNSIVAIASGDNGAIQGTGNDIRLTPNAGDVVSVSGTDQRVSGDSGNDNVSSFGNGTSLTLSGGGVVGVNGSNTTVSLTDGGSTVYTAPDISGLTVTGNNALVVFASNDSGNVQGTGDTISVLGATTSTWLDTAVSQPGDGTATINETDGNGGWQNIYDHSDGTSTVQTPGNAWYISEFDRTYSQQTGTGLLEEYRQFDTFGGGSGDIIHYRYDSQGNETGYTKLKENDNGQIYDIAGYDPGGQYVDRSRYNYGLYGYDGYSSVGSGGGYYGYGYGLKAGTLSVDGTKALSIGEIARSDLALGNTSGASLATHARNSALLALLAQPGPGQSPGWTSEGAHWTPGQTITWSFAPPSGTTTLASIADDLAYQAAMTRAIGVWAAATGMKFVEVSPSQSANIQIGWGNLGTSGDVLGLTKYTEKSGTMQSAKISFEDPSLSPLSLSTGTPVYTNAGTSLYQVALHEIGHALGFGDSSDLTSIMYPELSAQNTSLDQKDLLGASAFYAAPAAMKAAAAAPGQLSASAGSAVLAQTMASFGVQAAPTTAPSIASITNTPQAIAAPAHAV